MGWNVFPQFHMDVLISNVTVPEDRVIVVQSLNCVWLFVTPWTAAHQASLSFTISQNLLRFMFTESVMLSNHLILCWPLLLSPSIFPSIRIFYNELALHIRWPKCWSFSFSISHSNNIQDWFPLGLTGLILQSKGLSRVFNTTIQKHQFFSAQPSLWSNSHIHIATSETIALIIWAFVGRVMSLLLICCLGLYYGIC